MYNHFIKNMMNRITNLCMNKAKFNIDHKVWRAYKPPLSSSCGGLGVYFDPATKSFGPS